MQSSVCGTSHLTAHVLRKRLSWYTGSVGKNTHGTDAYGYDSTKNEASPGSFMLSHILPQSVMLPVDSLSKRNRNQLQGIRKRTKTSWTEPELMPSLHIAYSDSLKKPLRMPENR